MRGWLIVDKPAGPTAHDIVAQARRRLKFKRIGHSGTLDPPATGVLVLAIGTATRLLRFLPGDKVYRGRITFGTTTDTLDATGQVLTTAPVALDVAEIDAALARFVGAIEQIPPMVSAVQIQGKRLYELARAGQTVERQPRPVTIHALDRLSWESPQLDVRVHCSAGTYIRTLADDLGRMLGPGAHLSALRRERANGLDLAEAIDLATADDEALLAAIRPLDEPLADYPAIRLGADEAKRFRHGNALAHPATPGFVRLYDGDELLGMGLADGQSIKAEVVLVGEG